MKVGIRTPSPTKSVKARTTGRIKRTVKNSYNPVYGKKGIGYLKDPERAVKNKIYHKLTVDPLDSMKHPDSYEPTYTKPSHSASEFIGALLGIIGAFALLYSVYRYASYKEIHLVWIGVAILGYIMFFVLRKKK